MKSCPKKISLNWELGENMERKGVVEDEASHVTFSLPHQLLPLVMCLSKDDWVKHAVSFPLHIISTTIHQVLLELQILNPLPAAKWPLLPNGSSPPITDSLHSQQQFYTIFCEILYCRHCIQLRLGHKAVGKVEVSKSGSASLEFTI